MDRLTERLDEAGQALRTLEELQGKIATAILRDAAIMRFAYTFEATWKAAQRYLAQREGIEAGSPKACIRACRDAGLLTDAQGATALAMADDRNLVVHTYREPLARALAARLPNHAALLRAWLAAVRAAIGAGE